MSKDAPGGEALQSLMSRLELLEHYSRGANLLSGAQLNVGHSYDSLKYSYRAITSSREKCARSQLLIKEVESELRNYRLRNLPIHPGY